MTKTSPAVLAIETSCDETAAAVLTGGRIQSSIIASQALVHARYGGVVPEVAAREHVPVIMPAIDQALKKAKIRPAGLDVIAVTRGPGLATSLAVGIDAAKSLALAWDKPLLPINHLEAHIYANFSDTGYADSLRLLPALILIVSGGHTMLVHMAGHGEYKILGETMDDAAGEAFDKTAKLLGLGYPGGPAISRLAADGDPARFPFPRPMLNSPGIQFSFSGLKTAVLYQVQKLGKVGEQTKRDLAASVQAAIVDSLIGKFEQAAKKTSPKTIMLGGGVAANKRLREAAVKLADRLGIGCSLPPAAYCTDNAAMIGLAAHFRLLSGKAKYPRAFRGEPNLPLK